VQLITVALCTMNGPTKEGDEESMAYLRDVPGLLEMLKTFGVALGNDLWK
jgi:hypothetical protein